MFSIMNEKLLSKLQAGLLIAIRVTGTASLVQKLQVGSILKYTSQPTFTDPLDIVNKAYVDGGGTTPLTVSFTTASAYPYVIPTFSITYSAFFGLSGLLPGIQVFEDKGSSVSQFRNPDCAVYDGVANTLTIDLGTPTNGSVVIYKR